VSSRTPPIWPWSEPCTRSKTRVLIDTDELLQDTLDLLISVTGIADASAIQLSVNPEEMQARQWSTMARLDPLQLQSGFSVNKKPPLQSRQPLHAVRHDPNSRPTLLPQLIEKRGFKKLQAICAIMRKLLHAFYAMLENRTPFEAVASTH